MKTHHGTVVAVKNTGVLLRGPSGSGKSDLALRLIDRGGVLVGDDRVVLTPNDGRNVLTASVPSALAGLIEVRGLGLLKTGYRPDAPLGLVVDLVVRDAVPRLPEDETVTIEGVSLPLFRLHAFDDSAAIKVERAVELLYPEGR